MIIMLPIQPLSRKRLKELETRERPQSRYWGYGHMLYDTFKEGMREMGFVEVSENHSLYSPVESFLRKDKNERLSRYTVWSHPANIVVFSHSYITGGYTASDGSIEPLMETVSEVDWSFQLNAGYNARAYNKYYRLHLGTVNVQSPLTGECVIDIHGSQTQGSHLADLNAVLTKLLPLKKKLLPFDKWCKTHFYLSSNFFYDFQPKPEWQGLNKDALILEVDQDREQQRQAYFKRLRPSFPQLSSLMNEGSSQYSHARGVQNLNAVESLEHYFEEANSHYFPESKKASFLKLVELILKTQKSEQETPGEIDFSNISSSPIYKSIGFAQLLLFFEPRYLMPYLKSLSFEHAHTLLTHENETGRTFSLQVLHQILFENPSLFRMRDYFKDSSKHLKIQDFLPDFIAWGERILGKEVFTQTLSTSSHSWSGEILSGTAYGAHSLIENHEVTQHVVELFQTLFPPQTHSLPIEIAYSKLERTGQKRMYLKDTLSLDILEDSDVWEKAKESLDKRGLSDSILLPLQTLLTQHRYHQTLEAPQISNLSRTVRL